MNVFDLAAKITLDTSEFENGLKKVAKVGAAALGATSAALVAFGKKSIDTGREFDSSMSQVAATLGYTTEDIQNNVNGAGDAFAALREKAQEMGAATNFSASEAAEGLNILAMSGYDAEQSMSMVEDVLHLAAAGSMDMASAAGFIAGSMKGFNDATKDSGYYADLMAKGATLANTSVSQLGEAMSAGAATSAAYSQDAQSMTVALLRLAEQGEVGSAAGTALAAAMKDLYTPTDDATDALEELGVSVYDEAGRARDFNAVVDELEASFEGMTEQQKNSYKQTIFGIQGLRAYNKMVVTGTKKQEDWNEALAGASEGAGEAAKQYETMTDNLQGDIDIMNSAIDGFKIAVSDKLMPSVREFVQFGSDSMSKFTEAFKKGGIEGLATEFGNALTKLLKMISKKLPTLVKAGSNLLKAFLDGVIDMLPDLADAGVDIVLELADSIGDNLPELAKKATDAIVTIIRKLADNAPKLIEGAAKVFAGLGNALVKAIPAIIKEIPNLLKAIVKGVKDNAESFLPLAGIALGTSLLKGLKTSLTGSNAVSTIQGFMHGPGGLITLLAGSISLVGVMVANSFDEAYNTAREGAAKITPKEQEIIDKLAEEAEKWDIVRKSRQETAGEIDGQAKKYYELWEKLKSITDEQGNIKKGYEDEAEMIRGELKEALGIEIGIVDGQIENYEGLQKAIADTIEKKKAEMLLEAFHDDWVQAKREEIEAEKTLKTATELYNEAANDRAEGEAELAKLIEQRNKLDQDGMKGTYEYQSAYDALETKIKAAQGRIDGATEAMGRHRDEMEDAQKATSEYGATIENYNDLMTAAAQGGAEDIYEATTKMVNNFKDARTGTKQELVQQINDWTQEFEKQTELVEKYGDEESKQAQEDARNMVKWSLEELAKLDDGMADEFDKALRKVAGYEEKFKNVGLNTGKGIAKGIDESSRFIQLATTNALDSALKAGKRHALIASPSKLFRDEIGLNLGKGIAEGMDDAADYVRNASEGLIDAAGAGDEYETEYELAGAEPVAGGGITINVYGAAGQDINALADEIADRFQRLISRGQRRYA